MITQRFNSPADWRVGSKVNYPFLGLIQLCSYLPDILEPQSTMIEIGSYMGESTLLFASTGLFSKVYAIDPFEIGEQFNLFLEDSTVELNYPVTDFIEKEFKTNTRYFSFIEHLSDYSYNVADSFKDKSIDFIYIDGDHSYGSVKKDLELYLSKVKKGGVIAGHDYTKHRWPGVVQAVDEIVGKPDHTFDDTSWIKLL